MHRSVFVLLLAIMMGGCASGGSPSGPAPLRAGAAPDWRSLVGCWRVEHLAFVLDTVPVTTGWRGRESARQARSLPAGQATGKRFWLVTPHDTLEVVFEDGLWATRLEMVVRGDSLVGNRHIYGDVPSSPPTVEPAAGVREPCPAGVAAGSRAQPRRHRSRRSAVPAGYPAGTAAPAVQERMKFAAGKARSPLARTAWPPARR
jgi:hypothetical protein